MTPFLSLFVLVSVLLTSFLSGIVGMAGGMILMGLLAWQLSVQQAMIIHAIAQFFANASRAFIHREHIYRKTLVAYFTGLGLVFAVFTVTAFVTSKFLIFLLLGASPFLAYLLPKDIKLDFTKPLHAALCGGIVTFFQLASGVGGPLLDVFFQSRALSRHETVATKAFTQAVSHVAKFIYFAFIVGTLSESFSDIPLWLCAAIVPVAVFGTNMGKHILAKMDDKQFYRITQGLLFGIGALYLVKAAMVFASQGG